MGFLDKLQQTAKETLDKGKERLDELQAERRADQLLRELGYWHYVRHIGRGGADADAQIERVVSELQAHEAEHGPVGAPGRSSSPPPGSPPPTSGPPPPPPAT